MHAIVHTAAGGVEVLALRDVPTPEPGPDQIRVRVRAAGLNRADIVQRKGAYPAPPGWPADIPGLEYAGEVDAAGPGVTRWRPGDRVMGLAGGGAHAEYLVVHEDEALPAPADLSWTDAAAIPEAFLTAWDALATRGRLVPGETVLIHAVASGVGTAAVQLAKTLGATVLGTSRTPAKLDALRALGLDVAIDTSKRPFREQITTPVHLILDVLGGPAFQDHLAGLACSGWSALALCCGPGAVRSAWSWWRRSGSRCCRSFRRKGGRAERRTALPPTTLPPFRLPAPPSVPSSTPSTPSPTSPPRTARWSGTRAWARSSSPGRSRRCASPPRSSPSR